MNRHQHSNMENVWISFEWLLKAKLEELDHLTRQLYKDMQLAGVKKADIEQFLPERFSELWDRVAKQEDAKSQTYRRAPSWTRNSTQKKFAD